MTGRAYYFTSLYTKRPICLWSVASMPGSNIRLLRRVPDSAVHPAVSAYELAQEELWAWNHAFWLQNNSRFESERNSYCKDQSIDTSNAEGMAVFYAAYLRRHRKEFQGYHVEWCWKNLVLLNLAAKAGIYRLVTGTWRLLH